MARASVAPIEPNLEDTPEVSPERDTRGVVLRLPSPLPRADASALLTTIAGDKGTDTKALRSELRKASRHLSQFVQCFVDLTDTNDDLNSKLDVAIECQRTHAAEQDILIERWRSLALKWKAKVIEGEAAVLALTARCEAAEARCIDAGLRAAEADKRAAVLERAGSFALEQAALAERLSTKVDSRVVVAFGYGSRSNAVLRAVMTESPHC